MDPADTRLATLAKQIEAIVQPLHEAGIHTWLVGGAPRDALLGRETRDLDLLVSCDLGRAARLLPDAIRFGAQRPILYLEAAEERPALEISAPRAPFEDPGDPSPDLAERDFTCNALAWEIPGERLVDPLRGAADLDARTLRACSPDALRVDPVRILRGVRLCHDLGLRPTAETEAAMGRDSPALAAGAPERIRDELLRLLALPEPSSAIQALRGCGALAAVLPELLRTVAVAQNRHHPDDVFRHSLRVCDALPEVPLLRLAALLHDVAKPETKRFSDRHGDFSFWRHETRARPHVERAAERLRLSGHDRSRLVRLIRHHLLFPDRLESDAALRRMIVRVGRDILDDLLVFRRADLASRSEGGAPPQEWRAVEARIRAFQTRRSGQVALAIGGREIMDELGLNEGREVGRWLARLRRRVLQHPEENHPERLRAWLREAARRGD